MKTLFIALFCGLLFVSCVDSDDVLVPTITEETLYLTTEQLARAIVIPSGVFNEKYSNEENWNAYKLGGKPYIVNNSTTTILKDWYQQSVRHETTLRFDESLGDHGRIVTHVDSLPQDDWKVAWLVMLLTFLYYLLCGKGIAAVKRGKGKMDFALSHRLFLVAVGGFLLYIGFSTRIRLELLLIFGCIAPILALAVGVFGNKLNATSLYRTVKSVFFIGSLLTMAATWYFFDTFVLFVPAVAGLGLALLWHATRKKTSKAKEKLEIA
ncbi:hypothetical protein KC901_00660 [Patescibacteria group bacterium]|nr:hypothetical protein [Patescibacteria group bacterium]